MIRAAIVVTRSVKMMLSDFSELEHNKKIKSLTSFAGTHTCGAASPLCPTYLRPLFKSYALRECQD